MTDVSGSTRFEYDWRGKLRVKTQRIGSTTLTQRYIYNTAGQLVTQLLPSGKAIAYGYSGDQISRINIAGQPFIRNIHYNANGQIEDWQWVNGQQIQNYTRTHDLNGRLDTFNLGTATRTLGYDSVNNLKDWTDSDRPGQSSQFGYDRINQLEQYERRNGNALLEQQTLDYYDNGNRKRLIDSDLGTTTYDYKAGSNRLTRSGNQTLQTDTNGNIRNDGRHIYDYDARNRLTRTDNRVTYQYNAMNQRVKKSSPSNTTLYAWSNDRIIGEYTSNANPITETIYLNNTPVGLLKDGQRYRIYADQIDTPRLITSESNQPLWRWDSKPFGESQPNEDVDQNGQSLSYNLRFPGQYYDVETQTHYNYRRDYNPQTGRYLQSDPIGIEGGINTYGYVSNSPLMGRDPEGLVDFAGVGLGLVDFGLSTGESIFGIGSMIASTATGPAAPVVFTAAAGTAGHGLLGMLNSAVSVKNALFDECGPGLFEGLGGTFFGETGERLGAASDLFTGLRPAAIAAGAPKKVNDLIDIVGGVNTADDAFSSSNGCSN